MFQVQFIKRKRRPDFFQLSTTFYDLSVSLNLFSKAEMRQCGAWGGSAYETAGKQRVNFESFSERKIDYRCLSPYFY